MANILIIEDHRTLSRVYSLVLTQAGHDVRLEYTGEDGVEEALRERPDLIILDLGLPGISGAQVAQRLTESGILPDVPMIVATGLVDEGRELAQEFGAAGVLAKPFSISLMVAAVYCALNGPRLGAAELRSRVAA